MSGEGKWHWLYCCEEGWVYTLHTQGADKLTLNFGLKYSKEGPPKKAFEEDIEHRVSLPSSLVISGSFFHHLMMLLRLIQIDHLIAHSDLFKHTYNFTMKCSMEICFVVLLVFYLEYKLEWYSTSQTSNAIAIKAFREVSYRVGGGDWGLLAPATIGRPGWGHWPLAAGKPGSWIFIISSTNSIRLLYMPMWKQAKIFSGQIVAKNITWQLEISWYFLHSSVARLWLHLITFSVRAEFE